MCIPLVFLIFAIHSKLKQMKRNIVALVLLMPVATFGQQIEKEKNLEVIGAPQLTLESDLMTPEALWAFGRVSGQEVSPDGNTVLYGISYYSIKQNKGNRDLYTIDLNGENLKQITKTYKSEFNAVWRPDGKKIGFLTSESGSVQLWEINPDGTGRKQVSEIEGGITGFKYAPDQSKVLYSKEVPIENKFAN